MEAGSHATTPSTPARLYCLLVGAALLVGGLIGYFYESSFETGESLRSDEALGVLAVNGWHNLVHLASGAVLLALAGVARPAALAFGAVYTLVALVGFVATGSDGLGFVAENSALFDAIPVNDADNVLHLAIGLTGLAAGATTPRD